LADDSADMRDYVRRLLASRFDVQSVANGQEALQAIRERQPDLLLSDVMMPLLDGFGLLREIRADPDLSALPVILLSARAGDEAKISGLNAGADDYLIKPFSAQELLARVNANIEMARLRHKLSAELEVQKSQLQTVLETVPVAVWFTYDPKAEDVSRNRRATELLRLSNDAGASIHSMQRNGTMPFHLLQGGTEVATGELPLPRAMRGEIISNEEFEVRFDDGTAISLLIQASPLRDTQGQIIGAVCAALDISERKRVEDHRLLLVNELNHRVKNTLATVQSIAAQSFRGPDKEASGRQLFESRLLALSRTHDVLTSESWEGANLDEIVIQAVAPYRGELTRRFDINGPSVRLTAKTALSISMALHELATNAAKYGALSNDKGRITIKWRTQRDSNDNHLVVEWQEADGPPVKPPQHKGFGSRLIERGLARELGGETIIEYRPTGVWCRISTRLGGQ
jgi:two-component sensor histidine kinase/DNA-binding response OmpR family regulator